MDERVVEGLRKRYSGLHPLIFHRSVEHSKSASELFDVLESMPKRFPISWDEESRSWKRIKDITFQRKFFEELK